MKKILYTTLIILAAGSTVFAQNMVDALRLSDVRIQGTARATAMGNAFGALGGDFTSASINPAGLGLYRSNEFVFTTQLGKSEYDANYLETNASDSKFNISVPNIGYVVNFPSAPNSTSSLVSFSLGLGYNRMNNFNAKKLVMGRGATSSMLDQFAVNADDGYYDVYTDLAEQTGLIYTYNDDPDQFYYHDMLINNPRDEDAVYDPSNLDNFAHDQRRTISQKGSLDEYTISFAANFNHKVYLGATVGIQDVYYKETSRFIEDNVDYEGKNFEYQLNNYGAESYLKTTGTGVNFKVGAIFKPIEALRLGIAVHTPTYYDLHDNYNDYMYANIAYNGHNDFSDAESWGTYDYGIDSPWKGILSVAYVIGKSGLISVDYEYIDYSNMELNDGGDGYDFFDENQDIDEAFKSVGNLRVGGEYRVNNFFSLRGGYEYFPSPYKSVSFGTDQMNSDSNTSTYSAGFGVKTGGFFFDAAYKYIENTSYLELYQVPDGVSSPMAKMDYKNNNITFTLGFRF